MSDRGSHGVSCSQSGRSIRRRKSLLYRITDTITSFLPSLFESKEEVPLEDDISEVEHAEISAKRRRTSETPGASVHPASSRLPSQLSISCLEAVHIPTLPSSIPVDVDVDLDAADDRSEYSIGSRASVSTSGVSSLLPRSHRNEHITVKPAPKGCASECAKQGNSSNRNKGFIELWTDLEGSSQSTLNMTHSAPKRLRTESTQSSSSNTFSSPFYRGKVAYGGASSVRCTSKSLNVFEHVAPLRYIMDYNESETSKSLPSPSNAILSATAQRILQSLERHGSTISPSDATPPSVPIPFSPLSTPLQRSTTRYPSYMATYNRYKEIRRQLAVKSSTPSALPQFPAIRNRIEEHENDDVSHRKADVTAVTRPSVSFGSTQVLKSTSIQPHGALAISEKSQPTVICHSGVDVSNSTRAHEIADKVGLQVPTTLHDVSTSAKLPVETKLSSPSQQPKFVFSNPIALGPPTRPSVILPDASGFTFSHPKSHFKRPAPVKSSSFPPILMSSRQSVVADHPCLHNKVSVPSDLDLWRCESCLTENSGRDGVCKSCHLPASVPSSSKSNSSSTASDKPAFLVSLPSNGWECPTCMVRNKTGVSECVCCHTLNPSSGVAADASNEKITTAPIFNFGPPKSVSAEPVCAVSVGDKAPISSSVFNVGNSVTSSPDLPKVATPTVQSSSLSSKGWNCPTCLVKNADSLKDCPCCKTAKPKSCESSASDAAGCASIPGFSFSKPTGNNASLTTVTFCFGSNSGQTVATSSKFGDSAVQNNEIRAKFAEADKNKWECPTCMVKNSNDIACCPCCQTKRPTNSLKPTPCIRGESGGKWVCPTCLVRNDVSIDLCPCCQTKKPSKFNSAPVDGGWTSAKNSAVVSECVSCQAKKSEANLPIVSSPRTPAGSDLGSSQSASSPPVVMSTLRPSLGFGSQNPSTSSSFGFPAVTVSASSFSFSKPADPSSASAKSLEPPVVSMSSNLKNGGFNFGTPGTTSGFDFSAKKENVTPVVGTNANNFSSVSFNFGSSTVPAPVFKFGQPKLPSGGSSGDAGNTGGSSLFMANTQETGLNGRPIRRAVRRQNRE